MRKLLLSLVLFSASAGAGKPDQMTETDALKLQLANALLEISKLRLQVTACELASKYEIKQGDEFGSLDGKIKRKDATEKPKK